MWNACSATDVELAIPHHHQRYAARGQGWHLHRVEADADARHNLDRRRCVHFRLFERRRGQRDTGTVGQLRQQIGLGDAGLIDHRFDVVARLHDRDALLAHGVGQHHLAFVGGHGSVS